MGKRICYALFTAVLISLILAGLFHTYYVRQANEGELFWNSDGAYLFFNSEEEGYRFTYAGLALEFAREAFPFGSSSPQASRHSLTVLHVGRDSVQRYFFPDFAASTIEPVAGNLYASNLLSRSSVMKWAGTHFEAATPNELQRFYASVNSLPSGPSWDNVAGWSKRTVAGDITPESAGAITEADTTVTAEIQGAPLKFVMNSGYLTQLAYVDLLRAGEAPERIWHVDERPRRISTSAYKNEFPRGAK